MHDAERAREHDYLRMGDSLDRYARRHRRALRRHGQGRLVPKTAHNEIYSTLMVLVAKVREYLQMSRTAEKAFPHRKFVRAAATLRAERNDPPTAKRGSAGLSFRPPPPIPPWSKQELAVHQHIDAGYNLVRRMAEHGATEYGGIEERCVALTRKLRGTKETGDEGPHKNKNKKVSSQDKY